MAERPIHRLSGEDSGLEGPRDDLEATDSGGAQVSSGSFGSGKTRKSGERRKSATQGRPGTQGGFGTQRRSGAQGKQSGRSLAGDSEEPADPVGAARTICLRLLEKRPRTTAELATALAKRGVPDDAATTVLMRLTEVGLIDDAAFAQAWVASRHRGKGLSRRALGQELRQRGIDPELIEQATEQINTEDEHSAAEALVTRRLRTMRNLDPQTQTRRLVAFLTRKGYPPHQAYEVVRAAVPNSMEAHSD